MSEYRVFGQWDKAVGPAIARHARPVAVRGPKLSLVVDSSAWMQQLALLKPEIIEKLNVLLGRAAIKEISLKLGEVPRVQETVPAYQPAPVRLDEETMEQIDGYVRGINDAETRAGLRRLIEKDFQQKKRAK